MINFKPGDLAKMKALEVKLAEVLVRANDEKLEAAVAAFACIRNARLLLDKYPESTRTELTRLVVAYLRRDEVDEEGEPTRSPLLM